MGLGVGQGQRPRMGGDVADQALADAQAGLMHGGGQQALGGEQFEHFAGTHHVAGADLRHHVDGDQLDDLVEAFLRGAAARHDVAQAAEQPARDGDGTGGLHGGGAVTGRPPRRGRAPPGPLRPAPPVRR